MSTGMNDDRSKKMRSRGAILSLAVVTLSLSCGGEKT
jgi:hypothetical protein